jgi:hypothetical protein
VGAAPGASPSAPKQRQNGAGVMPYELVVRTITVGTTPPTVTRYQGILLPDVRDRASTCTTSATRCCGRCHVFHEEAR